MKRRAAGVERKLTLSVTDLDGFDQRDFTYVRKLFDNATTLTRVKIGVYTYVAYGYMINIDCLDAIPGAARVCDESSRETDPESWNVLLRDNVDLIFRWSTKGGTPWRRLFSSLFCDGHVATASDIALLDRLAHLWIRAGAPPMDNLETSVFGLALCGKSAPPASYFLRNAISVPLCRLLFRCVMQKRLFECDRHRKGLVMGLAHGWSSDSVHTFAEAVVLEQDIVSQIPSDVIHSVLHSVIGELVNRFRASRTANASMGIRDVLTVSKPRLDLLQSFVEYVYSKAECGKLCGLVDAVRELQLSYPTVFDDVFIKRLEYCRSLRNVWVSLVTLSTFE